MGQKYSIRLVDVKGNGCYLSIRGKTSWCKRVAIKHASDIMGTRAVLFGAVKAEIKDETGDILKTIYKKEVLR